MLREELWRDAGALGGFPLYLVILIFTLFTDKPLFAQLLVGFVASFLITIIIRAIYFRNRPEKEPYRTFAGKIHASTFPSLHAMRSSMMATILASWMPNIILGIVLFLSAAGVGYSRVRFKRHFVKDVVAGYVIGVIVGALTVYFTSTIRL